MGVTLHFQSTGQVPGNGQPHRMLGGSMTIGRADVNDLVLPDPDKMISGRHCAIEDQDGNLVVIDFSTNGTFLNYGKAALGKTPTPLNDGDILSIGPYELLVEVRAPAAAPIAEPMPEERVSFGNPTTMDDFADPLGDTGGKDDFLDSLLGGSTSGPSSVQRDRLGDDGLMPPLGEDDDDLLSPRLEEDRPAQSDHQSSLSDIIQTPAPATSTIPDDWDFDLDLPDGKEAAAPETEPEPEPLPEPEPDGIDPFALPPEEPPAPVAPPIPETPQPVAEDPAPQPAPVAVPPTSKAPPSPGDAAAARAFLEALGAGGTNIPDDQLSETMARLGTVMHTLIAGVRSILMTRQSIKSEFRINQTVISAGANNPLKFSVSVDQAIEAMVRPATKGYLPAAEAATQAMDDIKAHEVAVMTGMEAALKGVLAELDPDRLAERIGKDKSLLGVLSNRKARYWDVFEAQYDRISDQAENDFHELFSREFARAYQAQLERLKK
jgi:type VI secretion system protein